MFSGTQCLIVFTDAQTLLKMYRAPHAYYMLNYMLWIMKIEKENTPFDLHEAIRGHNSNHLFLYAA